MRAAIDVYTLVVIAAAVILVCAVIYIYTQIINAPLADFLSSTFTGCGKGGQECCKNGWCFTGFVCSGNVCIENITYQIMIDESYLIYNNIETANRSQRDEFFSLRTGLGWEDCSNGQNCQNCHKIFNYSYATTCTDCSYCDSDSRKCRNCLGCDSAENGKYSELYECYDCSNCQNILYDLADSCSQCSFCNAANVTTIENGLTCSNCSQCDETKCYSCYDCGTENEICNECDGTGPTNCETRQDYELCKKVIDCIAFNEGEACQIEEILPLPLENGMRFSSLISDILTNCLSTEVKKGITNTISQKICNYDTSKINFIQNEQSFVGPCNYLRAYFSSDDNIPTYSNLYDMLTSNCDFNGITGENKGILFNDCGIEKIDSLAQIPLGTEIIYSSDPEIFPPLLDPPTTPRTPEGDIPVNLKVIVSNVSWNERFGNDCSYNVYLCAQEAIATYEDDPILYLYRNFSYFNESNYNSQIQTKKWSPVIESGYQINVTAIKYPKLSLNLDGRNADIPHIAKAFIAGLRDYFIFNSNYNQTVNFFCINSGLYPDWKTCYENNISVLINDNVPWNLTSFSTPIDTFSSLPDFKYIYYDSSKTSYNMDFDVELTFFVYTSNITKLNNTIIVSPVIIITPLSPFSTCSGAGFHCCIPDGCRGLHDNVLDSTCGIGEYCCQFPCCPDLKPGDTCPATCTDLCWCPSEGVYKPAGSSCTPPCSTYDQATCPSPRCEWCLECSAYKYSGGPNRCVDSGTDCGYDCIDGQCGAPEDCEVCERWDWSSCSCVPAACCLEENSLVFTPNDFKAIEDLKKGDYVFGYEDGKVVETKITEKSVHEGEFTLYFYKGYWFTGNHLVYLDNYKDFKRVDELSSFTKYFKGKVYNIQTDVHNYFGENGLLIHNK